ncbi:MAG: leucine-rich repeat protein, partial [Ruminococcus sp.]|nr:leucine-rich repeat protein [Ruminococcus sp.]
MRKCISAFLTSAMLFTLCCPSAAAAAGTDTGYELIFTIDNGSVTVTGVSGSGSTLEVPSTLAGLSVTSIADNFFAGSTELKTVILPDTLRSIGSRAFSACQKLNS